jgi:hypothetical protein
MLDVSSFAERFEDGSLLLVCPNLFVIDFVGLLASIFEWSFAYLRRQTATVG